MLEYIYICRHGFRSNWVDPSIKTSPTGMNRDPPLAVYGLEQSTILSEFLSDPNQTKPYPIPELVFSSPFYRCIQTSIPTAKKLGLIVNGKEVNGNESSLGGKGKGKLEGGVRLEHGVQEWYSPVIPSTGLHPRPSSPSTLSKYFPPNSIDLSYSSTVFPSRRGESIQELHERAELFIESWTSKIEDLYPDIRSVVIFAHAASLIALGRALTGDRTLDIKAGCASTSLYKRKPPTIPSETFESTLRPHSQSQSHSTSNSRPTSSLGFSAPTFTSINSDGYGLAPPSPAFGSLSSSNGISTPPSFGLISRAPTPPPQSNSLPACGVGEWDIIWNGKSDYLPNGQERNWSFNDIILKPGGNEVVDDKGDGGIYEEKDEWPVGLTEGSEKWLRRGKPPFDRKGKVGGNLGLGISSARM